MWVLLTIVLLFVPLATCALAPRAYRYVIAVGAALAAVEWALAYRDNRGGDSVDDGAELVAATGIFAALMFVVWLSLAALGVFLRRALSREGKAQRARRA
jgi:hypothetical protein